MSKDKPKSKIQSKPPKEEEIEERSEEDNPEAEAEDIEEEEDDIEEEEEEDDTEEIEEVPATKKIKKEDEPKWLSDLRARLDRIEAQTKRKKKSKQSPTNPPSNQLPMKLSAKQAGIERRKARRLSK